jgi:hypothetical protein
MLLCTIKPLRFKGNILSNIQMYLPNKDIDFEIILDFYFRLKNCFIQNILFKVTKNKK